MENRNVGDYKLAKDCLDVCLREEINIQELDLLYKIKDTLIIYNLN